MAYNTGNSLGSSDPRDVYDNASNFDYFSNALVVSFIDRLSQTRKTWYGIEQDSYNFLISSGFEPVHLVYKAASSLVVNRPTQMIDYSGSVYRVKLPAMFPITLTGNWSADSALLVDVGDASLRQSLASPNGAQTLVGGSLFKGESLDLSNVAPGATTTRGIVFAYYKEKAGALRVGGSDNVPLDDERNYGRGLPSQNWWGDTANIGLYSASFGRNGAAYGPYSGTFGHDCIAYGTASLAGGAGCATGNPDVPNDAFAGYCSISWGKNNLAAGEKCFAFGEEHVLNTRASVGLGYKISSQPSALTSTPIGSIGAGRDISLLGQAYGFGAYLNPSDGMLIGSGFNPGTPMSSVSTGEMGIGYSSDKPSIRIKSASGPGVRSRIGVGNFRALNHELDVDISPSNGVSVTLDGTGTGYVKPQGVSSAGGELPIAEIYFTHTNPNASAGEMYIRMNGRSSVAIGISADGSIRMEELKTAANISGSPSGTIYRDGNTLKIV